jgi:hypothetical protein
MPKMTTDERRGYVRGLRAAARMARARGWSKYASHCRAKEAGRESVALCRMSDKESLDDLARFCERRARAIEKEAKRR